MHIRIHTQYGTDDQRRQYVYCCAYQVLDDQDCAHIDETSRVFVVSGDSTQDAAAQARQSIWRLIGRSVSEYTHDAVHLEFVALKAGSAEI